MVHPALALSEGLCPSDSPTRSLARRFVAALRSRGSLAAARSQTPISRVAVCKMRSTLPQEIRDDAHLEDLLSEPSAADLDCVSGLTGAILIIGAAGKMGPPLAR